MPGIYHSIDRLNAMVEIFVDRGDGRLGKGEVGAVTGFYRDLAPSSREKVRDRIIELYQGSRFARGQKRNMFDQLTAAGFSIEELDGARGDSAESFARLSLAGQLDRIQVIHGDEEDSMGGEGVVRARALSRIPTAARRRIAAHVRDVKQDHYDANRNDWEAGVTPESFGTDYEAVYLNGSSTSLVGYVAKIYLESPWSHDQEEFHFFNRKGEHLGHTYHGE